MITRKLFLKNLVLGSLGAGLLSGLPTVSSCAHEVEIYRGYVRGLQYYEFFDIRETLNPGHELKLEREPENRFDPESISVISGSHTLGYIAQEDNLVLSTMLDEGLQLRAYVRRLHENPQEVWWGLRVKVKLITHSKTELL